MKTVLGFFILMILSCKGSSNLMEVNQIFSDKKIALSTDKNGSKDSLNLILPVEFEIKNVSKKVADVRLYYKVNNIMLDLINDYMVYNGENDKIIYAIEDLQYNEFPSKIVLKQSNYKISKNEAETLLKKYSNTSIKDLNTQKQIDLVPYKIFRKENPDIIKNLEKKPDSLILSIAVYKEKTQIIRRKINW